MKKYLQAPRTKALNSILSLFLLLLLASCATYESHNTIICSDPAAGPSANPSNTASCSKPSTTPTTHMWQYLDSYQFERTDYATYSYILVGRDTSNPKSTYLYQELIKSIQGSSINAEMFGTEIPTLDTNLFLIPVTPEDENENPSGSNLDFRHLIKIAVGLKHRPTLQRASFAHLYKQACTYSLFKKHIADKLFELFVSKKTTRMRS